MKNILTILVTLTVLFTSCTSQETPKELTFNEKLVNYIFKKHPNIFVNGLYVQNADDSLCFDYQNFIENIQDTLTVELKSVTVLGGGDEGKSYLTFDNGNVFTTDFGYAEVTSKINVVVSNQQAIKLVEGEKYKLKIKSFEKEMGYEILNTSNKVKLDLEFVNYCYDVEFLK